jgi:hypothetical protein
MNDKFISSRRALFVAAALSLAALAISRQPDVATATRMQHRVRTIAGSGATNCGYLKSRSDPKPTTDCVLNSFSNQKPFYVFYDTQEFEIDSHFIDGLAGDKSGNIYDVEFSSTGWGPEGLSGGIQLLDGGHTLVQPCSKPIILRKSIYEGLTCIPRIMERQRVSK